MAIDLPDFDKAWDYENGFYLTSDKTRLSKLLAHYELYKMILDLPGAVVECGVFKGASLVRFATFRALMGSNYSRPIIGFDIFGDFPDTEFEADKPYRERFVDGAGLSSISVEQLTDVLARKGLDENVTLVPGDITRTVPAYAADNPHLKIALLNLDTDVYEPAVTILEQFWDRIVPGGVLILDDYGTFPGETKAVDDFFKDRARIRKFNFAMTPCYVVKGEG